MPKIKYNQSLNQLDSEVFHADVNSLNNLPFSYGLLTV